MQPWRNVWLCPDHGAADQCYLQALRAPHSQHWQNSPVSHTTCCRIVGACVYYVTLGLMQCPAPRSSFRPSPSLAADSEPRCQTGHQNSQAWTPVLRRLHWLPVGERIDYKMLIVLLAFKGLHGLAPRYLAELLVQNRHIRPSVQHLQINWWCPGLSQNLLRQSLLLCCTQTVEQSAPPPAPLWFPGFIQDWTENFSFQACFRIMKLYRLLCEALWADHSGLITRYRRLLLLFIIIHYLVFAVSVDWGAWST